MLVSVCHGGTLNGSHVCFCLREVETQWQPCLFLSNRVDTQWQPCLFLSNWVSVAAMFVCVHQGGQLGVSHVSFCLSEACLSNKSAVDAFFLILSTLCERKQYKCYFSKECLQLGWVEMNCELASNGVIQETKSK